MEAINGAAPGAIVGVLAQRLDGDRSADGGETRGKPDSSYFLVSRVISRWVSRI